MNKPKLNEITVHDYNKLWVIPIQAKNRIVIPQTVLRIFDIEVGDSIILVKEGDNYFFRPLDKKLVSDMLELLRGS